MDTETTKGTEMDEATTRQHFAARLAAKALAARTARYAAEMEAAGLDSSDAEFFARRDLAAQADRMSARSERRLEGRVS